MKKIKKIFPLLLGIMVLMFGTLTVSAAETVDYNLKLSDMNTVATSYYDSKHYSHPTFSFTEYCYYKYDNNTLYVYATLNHMYKSGYNSESFSLLSENGGIIYRFKYYIDSKTYDTHVEGAGHQLNYSLITKLQSSANIIDRESGDVFFTRTLRPPVAVQAEVLPEVVQGQTKVILTIAVVCLALLVILSVLPKKLPRFLNR